MSSVYRLENLYNLSNKVALVTGGGTGIGLMITYGLAANGAKVYITGRREDVLRRAADSWDGGFGSVIPLMMDVTNRDSILEVQKVIEEREGKLHVLVNNAGQTGPVSQFFNDQSAPEHANTETLGRALFDNELSSSWAGLYSVNTFPVFFVTTAFLGLLDKGAREKEGSSSCVINITSISGVIKLAQNHFAYNSAKAAASHLTQMMATEFALKGIPVRVNAIAPGVYESEMTSERLRVGGTDAVGNGIQPVPLGRPGTAQEMAATAVYLATNGYVNGQEIVLDGGYVAVNPSKV